MRLITLALTQGVERFEDCLIETNEQGETVIHTGELHIQGLRLVFSERKLVGVRTSHGRLVAIQELEAEAGRLEAKAIELRATIDHVQRLTA